MFDFATFPFPSPRLHKNRCAHRGSLLGLSSAARRARSSSFLPQLEPMTLPAAHGAVSFRRRCRRQVRPWPADWQAALRMGPGSFRVEVLGRAGFRDRPPAVNAPPTSISLARDNRFAKILLFITSSFTFCSLYIPYIFFRLATGTLHV